jgi:methionyl-tRNA synthetase
VHFVGKDIIRFHCVIWPAMLMAAGIKPPRQVFAHGFLLTKGEKMSKSRGNVMSPMELSKIFTVDGYRYYFLSDVQFGSDGSISLERMVQVYNADLANTWGNLCSRVLNMTTKYLDGVVPELWPKTTAALRNALGNPLADVVEGGLYPRYAQCMNAIDYSGALSAALELAARANLYVEESAPWALAKAAQVEAAEYAERGESLDDATAPTAADHLAFVLYNLLETIRILALYLAPVMPESSSEVYRRLGLADIFATTDLADATRWGGLAAGLVVTVGEPLFPRLDVEEL